MTLNERDRVSHSARYKQEIFECIVIFDRVIIAVRQVGIGIFPPGNEAAKTLTPKWPVYMMINAIAHIDVAPKRQLMQCRKQEGKSSVLQGL